MSVADYLGKLFARDATAPVSQRASKGSIPSDRVADRRSSALVGASAPEAMAPETGFADTSDFSKSRAVESDETLDSELVPLPLLGRDTIIRHQRRLYALLALGLVALALITANALTRANRSAQQLAATGQALFQSQRLAKSATQAIIGNPESFPGVSESSTALLRIGRAWQNGGQQPEPLRTW